MLLTILLFLPLICYYYSNYSQITDFEMDRTYRQPTTIFFEHSDHYSTKLFFANQAVAEDSSILAHRNFTLMQLEDLFLVGKNVYIAMDIILIGKVYSESRRDLWF